VVPVWGRGKPVDNKSNHKKKMKLDQQRIEATRQLVIEQGEPITPTCFEDCIGNLRGVFAYLENVIDTLEEVTVEWGDVKDGNASFYLNQFQNALQEARYRIENGNFKF
jgi:exonuclease VII small subunit